MSAPVQFYSIKLKGSGEVEERAFTGTFFLCTDATADFEVCFDGSTYVPWRERQKISFAGSGFTYNRLWFKVPAGTADDINISFICSVAAIDIDPGDLRNAQTVNYGFAAASIAANSNAVFSGTRGGAYRKAIIITNNDPGSNLEVWTSDGTTSRLATVFASKAWIAETSDDVMVKNETSSAIACRVMEIFYK